MDWSGCSAVERIPGKVSGVPIVCGSRVQADAVWENYQDAPAEEVADMFDLDIALVRQVIAYAETHEDAALAS